MGIGNRIGAPSRAVALLAIGAAGAGAAIAVASVPDSNGVIHACVNMTDNGTGVTVPNTNGPNVVIIDPSAGQHCIAADGAAPNQSSISWNQTGPPGTPGTPGQTGAQGPAGNTLTVSGQAFSLSNGKTLTINGNPVIAPLAIQRGARPVGTVSLGSGPGAPPPIQIDSWSFGATQQGSHSTGGGGGAGKVNVHDIQITKFVDKASPLLFKACVAGTHYKKVTLALRKAGGTQQQFLTITLHDALISSYQQSSGGGDKPTESISLNFTKIEVQYSKQS